MVKSKTSKNIQESPQPVSVPLPVPVIDSKVDEIISVPVNKKSKKSKKDVVTETPTDNTVSMVVPPVVDEKELSPEPVVATTSEVVVPPVLLSDNVIVVLLSELASLDQQEVAIQQQRRIKRRLLEKAIMKLLKSNNKAATKKQKRSGNRQPSGFIRPTLISDELASFLGKDSGTEMARTAVTNQINNYIKSNNLKDLKNGRQINADAKLSALLKLGKDDVLTYFNLQKYMKHHFVKKSVSQPTVTSSQSETAPLTV